MLVAAASTGQRRQNLVVNTAKLLDLRNLFTSQYGTRNSRWLWILKSSTVLSPWLTMPKLLNPVFMVQTYIFVAWTSVFLTQWHDRTVSSLPQVGKRTRFKQPHTHTHTIPSWICNKYIYTHIQHEYTFICTCSYMQIGMCVCMSVCMHACVCVYVYAYAYVYVYVYVCYISMNIIYIYTYIYTYIYM